MHADDPRPAGPVSGPSFLGLADDASDRVSYLLEDEPSAHPGRWLVLLVLLIGVGAAGWHWRGNLRSLASRLSAGAPATPAQSTANPAPAAPPPSTSQTPAPSSGTELTTPQAEAGSKTQTVPASSPAATPTAPPGTDQSAVPLASTSQPVTTGEGSPATAAQPSQASTAAAKVPPAANDGSQSASSDGKDQPDQRSTDDSAAPAAAKNGATAKSSKPARGEEDQAPDGSESDALESQGEKYLYGNGVAANCALAQRSLLAAAERSSARAQSVLGTMYATGHCAARDLPLAYRWFARALRQDPSNTRIEQDLKVLWNQMNPDERQVALKAER